MRTLTTMAIAVAIGVIAVVGFAYSGIYDVSASSAHSGIVDWLLSTTSHASVERRAKGIDVPDFDDETLILAGVNDFNSMCKGCHGAPGQDPEAMGQGLNAPAPDVAEAAMEMTPAELFWVTKNGIKMTGMPAWGATHDDDAIWPVVAFIRKLPELDATQYQDLLVNANGMGHHADDSADEGHSHDNETSEITDHDDAHSDDHQHNDSERSEDLLQEPEEHDHSTYQHESD